MDINEEKPNYFIGLNQSIRSNTVMGDLNEQQEGGDGDGDLNFGDH